MTKTKKFSVNDTYPVTINRVDYWFKVTKIKKKAVAYTLTTCDERYQHQGESGEMPASSLDRWLTACSDVYRAQVHGIPETPLEDMLPALDYTNLCLPDVADSVSATARSDIQVRLDFYEDFVLSTHYENGTAVATFPVDSDDVAASLSGYPVFSGLLPPHTLGWGRKGGKDFICIYVPPQLRQLSVAGYKESLLVPFPGLIFSGWGKQYRIFATTDPMPTESSELYLAPTANLGDMGVCQGSVTFPTASPGTIHEAVRAFFESGFNAHLSGGKSKKHPDNIVKLWAELSQARAKEYPLEDLQAFSGAGQLYGPSGVSLERYLEWELKSK